MHIYISYINQSISAFSWLHNRTHAHILQLFVSFLSTGLHSFGEKHDIFLTKSSAFAGLEMGTVGDTSILSSRSVLCFSFLYYQLIFPIHVQLSNLFYLAILVPNMNLLPPSLLHRSMWSNKKKRPCFIIWTMCDWPYKISFSNVFCLLPHFQIHLFLNKLLN